MGSPDFAVPSLRRLVQDFTVSGVVTQPDRPSGRGKRITPPPVKIAADELGIPCIQPHRLSQTEAMSQLAVWNPDVIVVAAFGQILRPAVLGMPPKGCINVHASLLPRWRGAAPIQAAILNGDAETGISIMRMDEGIDTGGVISQRAINIDNDITTETLSNQLADLGADLLGETLPAYLSGVQIPQTQDDRYATYAPMLHKEDGLLDFTKPADLLARQVRAFFPWPGTYTTWQGLVLKVTRAHAAMLFDSTTERLAAGSTIRVKQMPGVVTSQGILILDQVQLAGKKIANGSDFLRGARDWGSTTL